MQWQDATETSQAMTWLNSHGNADFSEEAENPLSIIRWKVPPLQKQGKIHSKGLAFLRLVGGIHVGETS